MQTTYAQKNETVQKASANTAESVVDSSSQSATLQRHASLANAAVQRAENPPRPNNTGLPDDLKNGIESLSGYSLDNVRVHYNSPKPATVQALAYTQGTDIHVAAGQEHALPHEAWHVTQQMAGRVTPTTNIGGMPVNDNAALEHEADVMGEKAVTQRKVDGSASLLKSVNLNGGSVQRINVREKMKATTSTQCDSLYDLLSNFKTAQNVYSGINNKIDLVTLREKVEEKGLEDDDLRNIDIIRATKQSDITGAVYGYSKPGTQTNEPACELVTKKNRATFDYEKYFTAISAGWLARANKSDIEIGQINYMITDKSQGGFTCELGTVYHHNNKYPPCGKPLWQIKEGKVKILGMYHHPDYDYTTYICDKIIEGNGNTIIIS